jgi:hypothetical protein
MGVASLVLGIIGLLFALIPFFGMWAWPLTTLALVLGYFGMKQPTNKGTATAGFVLGLLGTALVVVWYVLLPDAKLALVAGSLASLALLRRAT